MLQINSKKNNLPYVLLLNLQKNLESISYLP
jgi:hypothetical protein